MRGLSRGSGAYAPAEDTLFLDDHVRGRSGRSALDMGTGSGYIARTLEASFELVVATDIDAGALAGMTYPAGRAVCCDGADALACGFDLVACNPPYLATAAVEDPATDGGPGGSAVPLRMVRSAAPLVRPGGAMLVVTSSLSDHGALLAGARAAGLRARVAARRRLFFEELLLVEAVRPLGAQ